MPTESIDVSARQAVEVLGEVARLRQGTRRSLGVPWFPMVCFGALTILSAPLVAAVGPAVLAPTWLVAGTAGMLLIRRHYRLRARRRGVSGGGPRVWGVALAMFAGCFAAGVVGGTVAGEAAGVLAPIIVVVAGYVALGCLQRNPVPSLAVAPGAGLAVTCVALGLAPWVVELTFGAGLLAAGAGLLAAERRS